MLLSKFRYVDANTQLKAAAAGSYAGTYGSLTVLEDGSCTYRLDDSAAVNALAQGQVALERFIYGASDGALDATASLEITVTGTNDAPVATGDAAHFGAGSKIAASGNVLANDRDADSGTVLKVAAAGTFAGSYSYTVNTEDARVKALGLGQSLVESISYQATDCIASSGAKLDITINGETQKPVLTADCVTIKEDQFFVLGNVLSNDSARNIKVAMDIDIGNYGAVALGTNGGFIYTLGVLTEKVQSLGRATSVVDHFDYYANYNGTRVSSSLDVTVLGQNDAPEVGRSLSDKYINVNKAFAFQLPGSFTDIDKGDVLGYSATLANGAALPSWLKFDAATGSFSGTAPKQVSTLEVRVTATDKVAVTGSTVGSLSVSDVFKLSVDHGNNGYGNGLDAPPPGKETDKDSGSGQMGGKRGLDLSFFDQDAAPSRPYDKHVDSGDLHGLLVGIQAPDFLLN